MPSLISRFDMGVFDDQVAALVGDGGRADCAVGSDVGAVHDQRLLVRQSEVAACPRDRHAVRFQKIERRLVWMPAERVHVLQNDAHRHAARFGGCQILLDGRILKFVDYQVERR